MARLQPISSDIPVRKKMILSGLFLSKFDSIGLQRLGFDSFTEAFNAIGYALRSRPASVKNYRDEFDPQFSNKRKGWHKRQMRKYCQEIYEEYGSLSLDDFSGLVGAFFGIGPNADSALNTENEADGMSAFAQRLVTGLAAERYFESIHPSIPEFQGRVIENTTSFGCGYDFRMRSTSDRGDFFAIEVKGLKEQTGSVALTQKEYNVASVMKERFYLFVVRNFREAPSHSMFQNPINRGFDFRRIERVTVQVSWLTSV